MNDFPGGGMDRAKQLFSQILYENEGYWTGGGGGST